MRKPALVLCLFFFSACGELSEQTLGEWARASDSAKERAVAIHFAGNPGYFRKCLDGLALTPGNRDVGVLEAGEICKTGLRLNKQNAKKPAE